MDWDPLIINSLDKKHRLAFVKWLMRNRDDTMTKDFLSKNQLIQEEGRGGKNINAFWLPNGATPEIKLRIYNTITPPKTNEACEWDDVQAANLFLDTTPLSEITDDELASMLNPISS